MAHTPFGLLGHPVEHSLSPAMHNAAFRNLGLPYSYVLMPVEPAQFGDQVARCVADGFAGWNVTVPHKERMLPYLDSRSAEVAATGACNTVLVKDGKLHGFNTDIAGFMEGLREAGGSPPGSGAVILGAGGVARAVTWALVSKGYRVTILSRQPGQAARIAGAWGGQFSVATDALDATTLSVALDGASLLVNCTPVGMWPNSDDSPLPDGCDLPPGLLVYDLVYRPRPTKLLQDAERSGCRTQDGLSMLVHQGAASFEIWTGVQAPGSLMRAACLELLEREKAGTIL